MIITLLQLFLVMAAQAEARHLRARLAVGLQQQRLEEFHRRPPDATLEASDTHQVKSAGREVESARQSAMLRYSCLNPEHL